VIDQFFSIYLSEIDQTDFHFSTLTHKM